jgi:hypothetical protein
MLFLYTSKFDLKVQEAKDIQQFFSSNEIKALKEEKNINKKPDDVKIKDISNKEGRLTLLRIWMMRLIMVSCNYQIVLLEVQDEDTRMRD